LVICGKRKKYAPTGNRTRAAGVAGWHHTSIGFLNKKVPSLDDRRIGLLHNEIMMTSIKTLLTKIA